VISILGVAVLIPNLAHATSASAGSASVPVNLLLNYGNGTLSWYNQTLVPQNSNFYNVTAQIFGSNLGAVYFASFGSHFIYSINGVGCPASNIFCDVSWGFWTLDGVCWDLPFTGVDQIPVTQAMTVAWFLQPISTFGETPPTGSSCLSVNIEVKPGSNQTVINVGAPGVIPVAILSTNTFNATRVNPMKVRFGKTGTEASPLHWALKDVNGDGLLDMILQFSTQNTGLQLGATQVVLMGMTTDGTPFRGFATIKTISH
jgi:hypothetical protein